MSMRELNNNSKNTIEGSCVLRLDIAFEVLLNENKFGLQLKKGHNCHL